MTKESIQRAMTRIDKGIVTATENIEKGFQVDKSREALEDLQICKEALEKQIAKKVIREPNANFDNELVKCPTCKGLILEMRNKNYCDCGQKLNWEDTNGQSIHRNYIIYFRIYFWNGKCTLYACHPDVKR